MLKTCLFVLHQRLPDPTVELLPEQWALLIYEQLLQFIKIGHMPILFDIIRNEPFSSLLHCKHKLEEMLEHDELRAGCCDQRIDLLIIAEHLYNILQSGIHLKHVISVAHIFVNLPQYDHDAGFLA